VKAVTHSTKISRGLLKWNPPKVELSSRIREIQRYRHPVAEDTGVVVEFGEGKNIFPDQVDVCPALLMSMIRGLEPPA